MIACCSLTSSLLHSSLFPYFSFFSSRCCSFSQLPPLSLPFPFLCPDSSLFLPPVSFPFSPQRKGTVSEYDHAAGFAVVGLRCLDVVVQYNSAVDNEDRTDLFSPPITTRRRRSITFVRLRYWRPRASRCSTSTLCARDRLSDAAQHSVTAVLSFARLA